ncbi:MAG: hypothetical protein MJD61_13135 [Proteobacteria bacterium]|nr:hypothetical protein [Pseudomonadota bacterium]
MAAIPHWSPTSSPIRRGDACAASGSLAFGALALFGGLIPHALLRAQPKPPAAHDSREAEEDGWGDASDELGFAAPEAEQTSTEPALSTATTAGGGWYTTGFARSQWGVWMERLTEASGPSLPGGNRNPFAKGRQSLDLETRYSGRTIRAVASLHAEYDVAYWVKRGRYDQPTLDAYRSLVYLGETYVSKDVGPLRLSIGRQIVAWGQGEAVSLVDVVNPRDLREPGLADLDDSRLPVLATRAAVFAGFQRAELMVVHEAFFGYRTPPRGPFSSLPALLAMSPMAAALLPGELEMAFEDRPGRFGLDTQQWLLRWTYEGPCLDAGLYLASVLDQQVLLDRFRIVSITRADLGTIPDPGASRHRLVVELTHPRYTLLGYSGALPFRDLVFKWEAYAALGRRYNVAGPAGGPLPSFAIAKTTEVGHLWAVTYSGITDTQLSLELAKRWLGHEVEGLVFPVRQPVWALRATHSTLRQDLQLVCAVSGFGWTAGYGWLGRAEVTYALRDGLKIAVGAISYQPGDRFGFLAGLRAHDRVFARLRYDFALE